jgi:site-specific DNA-methyltransferase (adenine-specific)
VTDPPFFIGISRDAGGVGSDPWTPGVSSMDDIVQWHVPLAEQFMRTLRPGGSTIVMGGAHSISAWEVAASRAGLIWMAELIVLWNTGKPRVRNFGSLHTVVRWHIKPGARHIFNSKAKAAYSNVIMCDKVPLKERYHPAQKPVELTNLLVSLLTTHDDVIVDPFCGSGSTLVSAAMCDRSWIGSDTDYEQCLTAEMRTERIELEEAHLRPIWYWINNRLVPVED